MIDIITRPPGDTFTYNLICNLINNYAPKDVAAYYIWSNPPGVLNQFMVSTNFANHSNVIIVIKDLLDMWEDYSYWEDSITPGIRLIDEAAQRNPGVNFIIVTSLEGVIHEKIKSSNVQFIPSGGDCVNQHTEYQLLAPVIDKNLDSKKHVISLNRNLRDHRIVYVSYLLGQGLQQHIDLSFIGFVDPLLTPEKRNMPFLDRISWQFNEEADNYTELKSTLLAGHKKLLVDQSLQPDSYLIYQGGSTNDNIANFNQSLRQRYQNSFLEIVTESSFCAPSFMLTEKTMHCFYGCNIPIILAGAGAVAHLREVGFDMFDEFVDHTYDTITNPLDRIVAAVESNRHLITNSNLVKDHWQSNKDRILKNVSVANSITDYYSARAKRLWSEIRWK